MGGKKGDEHSRSNVGSPVHVRTKAELERGGWHGLQSWLWVECARTGEQTWMMRTECVKRQERTKKGKRGREG